MSRARGSIIRRGGTYSVVLDLGQGPDGKRIRRWHSGFTSKRAAEQARTSLLSAMDERRYVEPSRLTVGAFLVDRWLPFLELRVERPRTYGYHRDNVLRHLVSGLSQVLLQDLDAGHLDTLYGQLQRAGLADITICHVHATIRKALRQAQRWNLVARNVAADASPPSPENRPMSVWTAPELRTFLASVADDRLAALWRLAAMTGMRRGEVLALKWAEVDLEHGQLSIPKSKTKAGRRTVALDPTTVAALKAWRRQQATERLALGPEWSDTGLAFTRLDGERVRESWASHTFRRKVRQLGLPLIRLHDLRHSWATLALQSGVHAKVVSERLGHASISVTMDTYSHVIPGMQEQAAAQVAALVVGP